MRSRQGRCGGWSAAGGIAVPAALLLLLLATGASAADEPPRSAADAPPRPAAGEPAAPGASSGRAQETGSGRVQETQDAPPPRSDEPAPDVDLDRLLRLPHSFESDVDRRGGATVSEWRARFESARTDLAEARKRLAKAEAELEKTSGTSSAWQVSAPGSSDPQTSPLSIRLREEIRSEREAIDGAERRLRALDVQADLAAVPPEWREASAAP